MTETTQAHTLKSGTTLDSYQIHQVLGIGGFGITYKAIDLNLDCLVAIKEYFPAQFAVRAQDGQRIQPKSATDQTTYEFGLQRFMDEARLLAKFADPNIVRVRRYIEDNGSAYIIMDYEEGLPLSRYLMRCTTLSEAEVKMVFQPILNGLHTVHAMNFLHRDIKPPNIYLRTGGTPVLLDFGAARQAVNQHGRDVTNLGTHFYAPYEQFTDSDQQGPWTDIYGLGATLYHCLTGHAPVSSLDRISAVHGNRHDPLIPAVFAGKDRYSLDLLACVDWMLQLRVEDRPQSTEELTPVFANTNGQPATAPIVSKNDVDWNAELISRAEQHLTKYLGPLAAVLVKRTMSQVQTVEDLYLALAKHIDSAQAREQFCLAVNANASITSTLHRRNHAATMPLTAELSTSRNMNIPRQIDPGLSERLIQQLAYHIGPMARLLVRQAVDANYDLEQIIDILAKELPSETERERFRKQFAI